MDDIELEIDHHHPLALELSSLRTAVSRFQHEAHTSALKLQRHSLEAALAIERSQALEHENAAVHAELAVLREYPDTTPHPAELQLPELTLALRRASDKLTLAEDALRTQTSQFMALQGASARAHHAAENAFSLAASARAREEDALSRERALMLRLRAAVEENKMTDRAVREYADLVRRLEQQHRQSLSSSSPPSSSTEARRVSTNGSEEARNGKKQLEVVLQEDKAGLRALVGEFAEANEALRDEIGRLEVDLEGTRAELDAERKAAEKEREQLADALTNLYRAKHDDNAAAKMVSRYMKFSQATADTLQDALESLKARHDATTSTLHVQLASAQAALATEQRQCARLRDVLDEATEQLARETYGRRREIALRLAVVGREDQLAEALRRWVRRTQETQAREDVPIEKRLDSIVGDAGELLALVEGAVPLPDGAPGIGIGSVGRIVAAENAVGTLVEELQVETERRMKLERLLGRAGIDEEEGDFTSKPLPDTPVTENGPQVVKVDAATSPICSPPPQATVDVVEASPIDRETPSRPDSPAFLTPHSTPSPSLPLQDTKLASTNDESSSRSTQQNSTSLLAELGKAKNRYDELQRAFRDCHLALHELGQTLQDLPPSSSLPTLALQTILSRLDDFNEDARVELEIRIADEERILRGYATLLAVPGAISSAEEAEDVEHALRAFVNGSDASVARAQSQFARKRDDLEHDIAALKRAVHEVTGPKGTSSPSLLPSPSPSSRPTTPAAAATAAPAAVNASWTSLPGLGLFSAGSLRPSSPSPTFGSVVTSPRPRRVPTEGGGGLAALQQQLRISMPELHSHLAARSSPSPARLGQRSRTTSGMYMLGLGTQSGVVPVESRKMSSPRVTSIRLQEGGSTESDIID